MARGNWPPPSGEESTPDRRSLPIGERGWRHPHAPQGARGDPFPEILGTSRPMRVVFEKLATVAALDVTVLVTGESGTGKELVARALHRCGVRPSGPFVIANCTTIPPTLAEAELFGHEPGAFTDARSPRPGYFEAADGGVLFLDEIGDLPLEVQGKLLRVLEDGRVKRVGSMAARKVDVQVVAATNKDLENEVRHKRFREDLFWRLEVMRLHLPPLRERGADLKLLVDHFVRCYAVSFDSRPPSLDAEAWRLLTRYRWPGNVRELKNTLLRAAILCAGGRIQVEDLPPRIRDEAPREPAGHRPSPPPRPTLAEAVREATESVERRLIEERMVEFHGRRDLAAQSLGISRRTLYTKLRRYGLSPDGEG